MTDNEVMSALLEASRESAQRGHSSAQRIVNHRHFRQLYERHPSDIQKNPDAGRLIFEAAEQKFGTDYVRRDSYTQKSGAFDFPVQMKDESIVPSLMISGTLGKIPVVAIDYVYIIPEKRTEAEEWIKTARPAILESREKEE